MRVLVCGGRDFSDYDKLARELDKIHAIEEITDIIHGCAPGADSLGALWCQKTLCHNGNYIREHRYKAEWGIYGKAAGPMRNQKMLNEGKPDLVVAFPGGKGTADMIRRAEAAGIKVIKVA